MSTSSFSPRRSALYMPGSRLAALKKARCLETDCIIMDLEDATAPDSKARARSVVMEEIAKGGYGHREIIVRVNHLGTEWGRQDVIAVSESEADAILIPKVESVSEVEEVQRILSESGGRKEIDLWCMIETPKGVLNVAEICRGLVKEEPEPYSLRGICMGFADLGNPPNDSL